MIIAEWYARFLMRESYHAAASVTGEVLGLEANKMLELDQENACMSADSARLEWLMRNVSGEEFRRQASNALAQCRSGRTHIQELVRIGELNNDKEKRK